MNQNDADRVAAIGEEILKVHRMLRKDLAGLRDGLAAPADSDAFTIRGLPARCLAFCSAVTAHHTDEDRSVFPQLAAELPQLADVLDDIARDHVLIAGILGRVRELAENVDASDTAHMRDEIDGLAAILESHFRWEERRIAGVRFTR
jgi:hypothetical protein